MRHFLVGTMVIAACLGSGCGTSNMAGDPNAILGGAAIGNSLGGAIGGLIGDNGHGWRGGYRGSAIGSIVGTVAGAAIGSALTAPKPPKEDYPTEAYPPYANTPAADSYHSSEIAQLRIRNIRFIDDSRDHALGPSEQSKVIFDIINDGERAAYGIVPVVVETTGMKNIFISPSVMVERILPGGGVKYTATVGAGKRLKNGSITLHVAVADNNGQEYDWHEFSIETRK